MLVSGDKWKWLELFGTTGKWNEDIFYTVKYFHAALTLKCLNVLCASLYRTRSCSSSTMWVLAVASSCLKERTSTTPSLTSSRWATFSLGHRHILFLLCLNINAAATWLVKLLASYFLFPSNTFYSCSIHLIVGLIAHLPKSNWNVLGKRKRKQKVKVMWSNYHKCGQKWQKWLWLTIM